jgi:tetratricopeptide (TPR) repeat protein
MTPSKKQKEVDNTAKKQWEGYFNAVREQDWKKSKESLQKLSAVEKRNPQIYLKLGDIHQRLGDKASAISAYHKSAWLLEQQGFIQKALALYKIILRIDVQNDEALKLSKKLIIELEKGKSPAQASGVIEEDRSEESEQKPEIETGMPLGFGEEKAIQDTEEVAVTHDVFEQPEWQEKDLTSEKVGDILEPTSYEEKSSAPTCPPPQLFSSIPGNDLNRFFNKSLPERHAKEKMIVEEGDSGDSVYLIMSGSAKVISHLLGKEIELATLVPGDIFGEIAFLTGRPRTSSVIALEDLEVLEFNKLLLDEIIAQYPEILKLLNDFYHCRVEDTLEKAKTKLKE